MFDKNTPHLWSSSTLYTNEEHLKKNDFFVNSLNNQPLNKNSILEMHGIDYDTPFILNLSNIKTVSITQFVMNSQKGALSYHLKERKDEQKTVLR